MTEAIKELAATFKEIEQSKKSGFVYALQQAGLMDEAKIVEEKGLPKEIYVASNMLQVAVCFTPYGKVIEHKYLSDNTILLSWFEPLSSMVPPEISFYEQPKQIYPSVTFSYCPL